MLLLVCFGSLGCKQAADNTPHDAAQSRPTRTVITQGQLLPATGIIQLYAQPGDPVAELCIEVGDEVEAGKLLAVMKSSEMHGAQTASLREQRDQAERGRLAAIEVAEQRLAAAMIRAEQVEGQASAIERRQSLLKLGQDQVEAAQRVLQRLERIANEPRTAEFVGELEVERQRIQVREAELKLREQEAASEQAMDELAWARRLAQAELQAAETQLKLAEQSSAAKVLDLQLSAAEVQSQSSKLIAPRKGKILAIHASKGEVPVQRPVLEFADLSEMICEVEINELDAARIEVGQSATVQSRAFDGTLHGKVTRKFPLVGRPQLRSLDPLAPADYRTVTATIALDPESSLKAKDWLQLQVEVTIDTQATP